MIHVEILSLDMHVFMFIASINSEPESNSLNLISNIYHLKKKILKNKLLNKDYYKTTKLIKKF